MKDINDIDILLEKFYEGETSLEEEVALRKMLCSPDLPEKYYSDKLIVESFPASEGIEIPSDLNNILDKFIDDLPEEINSDAIEHVPGTVSNIQNGENANLDVVEFGSENVSNSKPDKKANIVVEAIDSDKVSNIQQGDKTNSETLEFVPKINNKSKKIAKTAKSMTIVLYSAAVAAVLILMLSLSFYLLNVNGDPKDTFSDPKMAYAETERILKIVGDNLNKGVVAIEKTNTEIEKTKDTVENAFK
jgi:hypothetical protein